MRETEILRGLQKARAKHLSRGTPFVTASKGVPKDGDHVPAMLEHGEAVLPKDTVAKVGPTNIARLIEETAGAAPKVSLRTGGRYATGFVDKALEGVKDVASTVGEKLKGLRGGGTPNPYAGLDNARSANPVYQDLNNAKPAGTGWAQNPEVRTANMGPRQPGLNPAAEAGPQRPTFEPTPEPVRGTPGNGMMKPPPEPAPSGLRKVGRGAMNLLAWGDAADNALGAIQDVGAGNYGQAAAKGLTSVGEVMGAGRIAGAANAGLKLATGNGVDDYIAKGYAKLFGPGENTLATPEFQKVIDSGAYDSRLPVGLRARKPAQQPGAPTDPNGSVAGEVAQPAVPSQSVPQSLKSVIDSGNLPDGGASNTHVLPANQARSLRTQINEHRIMPNDLPSGTGIVTSNFGRGFRIESPQAAPKAAQPQGESRARSYGDMSYSELMSARERAMRAGDYNSLLAMKPAISHAMKMEELSAHKGLERARMKHQFGQDNEKRYNEQVDRFATRLDDKGKPYVDPDVRNRIDDMMRRQAQKNGMDYRDFEPKDMRDTVFDYHLTNAANDFNSGATGVVKSVVGSGQTSKLSSIKDRKVNFETQMGIPGYTIEGGGWVPLNKLTGGGLFGLGSYDPELMEYLEQQAQASGGMTKKAYEEGKK